MPLWNGASYHPIIGLGPISESGFGVGPARSTTVQHRELMRNSLSRNSLLLHKAARIVLINLKIRPTYRFGVGAAKRKCSRRGGRPRGGRALGWSSAGSRRSPSGRRAGAAGPAGRWLRSTREPRPRTAPWPANSKYAFKSTLGLKTTLAWTGLVAHRPGKNCCSFWTKKLLLDPSDEKSIWCKCVFQT